MTPEPALPAPKKKTNVLLVVALAIGVPVVLLLLLAGAVFLFTVSTKSLPVSAADRLAVVTADDLSNHMADFTPRPALEKLTKERYLDRSHQLTYEYNQANDSKQPLYLNCVVDVEGSAEDARNTYTGMGLGLKVGFAVEGSAKIEQEPHDELLQWGDESKSVLLTTGGKPVGNFFIARKGTHIFSMLVSGVFFKNPAAFQELVKPKLDSLERYQP